MTNRWPNCVKIHENCGGIVRWVEAIMTPGVGYQGECVECGEGELVVEEILPVELPDDVRSAHQHEFWGAYRLKNWRDMEWDAEASWEENQQQFKERLGA